MTCRCSLCEPWNILAEECADEERLNALQQARLGVHGLTPKGLGHSGPQPNTLTKRSTVQRDGRTVVVDEAYDLTNARDRTRLLAIIKQAEIDEWDRVTKEPVWHAAEVVERPATWQEKTEPVWRTADVEFALHDYSTPFMRAVLRDQEQERLREYLRSRL